MQKKYLIFCLYAFFSFYVKGQTVSVPVQDEGLESLLFTEIPSIITRMDAGKVPASVTTITEEDIRLTPARNLFDLMEVYVPGALYMTHSEGMEPAIRGISSDRKNKFLCLVNGKAVNIKGHTGVSSETENWDLGDIYKIEIIRGPGSVTYGPGAVMGVINIITKDAVTAAGIKGGAYYVSDYDAYGVRASAGKYVNENLAYYTYASYNYAEGIENPDAYRVASSGRYGYYGSSSGASSIPTSDYYHNTYDVPHLKFYANVNFMEEWKFWARYTNNGTPTVASGPKRRYMNTGDYYDAGSRQDRQGILSLDNNHQFSDTLSLKTSFSMMSSDSEFQNPSTYSSDKSNGTNYSWNFSEDQVLLKSTLLMDISDTTQIAFGAAYEYGHWGPGWGDSEKDFRMGDNADIVSGPDSNVLPALTTAPVYAGDGWNTDTWSVFGEFNTRLFMNTNVIASARLDKNTYTDTLFSPRLAIVSDWADIGITKFIIQRSLRMNNAEQLWQQDQEGVETDPEKFDGVELIYEPILKGDFSVSSSVFYNELEVLGWNGDQRTTVLLGTGSLYGAELELAYNKDRFMFGINHSYVNLNDWELEEGVGAGGFSYSDMNKNSRYGTGSTILLLGSGDDINNWSKNTTKFFSNFYFLERKLTLHANMQCYWKYEGGEDQLNVVESATANTTYETLATAAREDIEDKDAYETNFRLNMSVQYDFNDSLSLNVFVMNLWTTNDNKRYYYDSCNIGPYATRVVWVEEPTVYGIKMDYSF